MISEKERKDTLLYIYKNKNKIVDYTPYCNALSMTYDDIINYVPRNRTNMTNRQRWLRYRKSVLLLTYENLKNVKTDKSLMKSASDFRSSVHYVYDHKISVYSGYRHNIPCELISSLDNLRLITSLENSIKGMGNYIDDLNKHIADLYIK